MAKKRILLIDDDPNILKMLKRFLTANDYEVFTAQDGRVAVEMLKEAKPHLIITDLEMPRVDGLMFTAAIKKHPLGQKIPLIVLTAHSQYSYMQESYDVGADLFLGKPVKLELLKQQIDSLLQPKREEDYEMLRRVKSKKEL